MKLKRYLAFPVAFISLLLTHQLTYFILYPNGSIRSAILDATGHIWVKSIPEALTYTFLLIIYILWQSKPELLNNKSLIKISSAQYLAFIALEFSERIASGSNPIPDIKILSLGLLLTILSSITISFLIEKVLVEVIASIKKFLRSNKVIEGKKRPSIFGFLNLPIPTKFLTLLAPRSPPVK
jgi:hypothetical protein